MLRYMDGSHSYDEICCQLGECMRTVCNNVAGKGGKDYNNYVVTTM